METQQHHKKGGGQGIRRYEAELGHLVEVYDWMEEPFGQMRYSIGHTGGLEKSYGYRYRCLDHHLNELKRLSSQTRSSHPREESTDCAHALGFMLSGIGNLSNLAHQAKQIMLLTEH